MINEDIIREYDLAYKRKQWFSIWRYVASAHYEWIAPYVAELHKRGAYPIVHYFLSNYYTDRDDIVIASFIAAFFIKDDANILKSIESVHAYIGEHPYTSFRTREFVHWKQNMAVVLDGLYRVYEHYGNIQSAVMEHMKYALDPAEALFLLLKKYDIPLNMTRCRTLIVRLATSGGVGLGIWESFSPSIIMPPDDEVTKWYVSKMFPADTKFPFDELVMIMSDTPYSIIYDAMVLRLMAQADTEVLNYYTWRFQKTFYGMPTPASRDSCGYITSTNYITQAAPIYDFEANTLTKNPLMRGSDTWIAYDEYIKTKKGRAKMAEKYSKNKGKS